MQQTPDVLHQAELYSNLSMGIMVSDEHETIEWVNGYLCDLISAEEVSLLGAPVASVLGGNPQHNQADARRYQVRNEHGKGLWLECIKTTLVDDKNKTKNVRFLLDISEFQQRQSLRGAVSAGYDQSRIDEQTGALNRRAILLELNTEISRSRRYGNPLSVIMVRYELAEGLDKSAKREILQSFVGCLNDQLRWVDKLGSLSPSEFLLVLPESDDKAAELTWEKINNAIQDATLRRDQTYSDYQASIATWKRGDNADEIIERLKQEVEPARVA